MLIALETKTWSEKIDGKLLSHKFPEIVLKNVERHINDLMKS